MSVTAEWKKSSRSGGNGGNCLEVRRRSGLIEVRDSKNLDGGRLVVEPAEWVAFVDAVKAGAFDPS